MKIKRSLKTMLHARSKDFKSAARWALDLQKRLKEENNKKKLNNRSLIRN